MAQPFSEVGSEGWWETHPSESHIGGRNYGLFQQRLALFIGYRLSNASLCIFSNGCFLRASPSRPYPVPPFPGPPCSLHPQLHEVSLQGALIMHYGQVLLFLWLCYFWLSVHGIALLWLTEYGSPKRFTFHFLKSMNAHAKSLQLYLTLCDPIDCSPPGSSIHGILRQEY